MKPLLSERLDALHPAAEKVFLSSIELLLMLFEDHRRDAIDEIVSLIHNHAVDSMNRLQDEVSYGQFYAETEAAETDQSG